MFDNLSEKMTEEFNSQLEEIRQLPVDSYILALPLNLVTLIDEYAAQYDITRAEFIYLVIGSALCLTEASILIYGHVKILEAFAISSIIETGKDSS